MDYDDERMLVEYVLWNRRYFMTPFEQRAEQLGIMREKAKAGIRDSQGVPPAWTSELLGKYEAQADDAVRNAIGSDLDSFAKFQQGVTDRIKTAFALGELRTEPVPGLQASCADSRGSSVLMVLARLA